MVGVSGATEMFGVGEFSGATVIFSGATGIVGVTTDASGADGVVGFSGTAGIFGVIDSTGAAGATLGAAGDSALSIESVRRAKSSITLEAATIEFPGSEPPEVGA